MLGRATFRLSGRPTRPAFLVKQNDGYCFIFAISGKTFKHSNALGKIFFGKDGRKTCGDRPIEDAVPHPQPIPTMKPTNLLRPTRSAVTAVFLAVTPANFPAAGHQMARRDGALALHGRSEAGDRKNRARYPQTPSLTPFGFLVRIPNVTCWVPCWNPNRHHLYRSSRSPAGRIRIRCHLSRRFIVSVVPGFQLPTSLRMEGKAEGEVVEAGEAAP